MRHAVRTWTLLAALWVGCADSSDPSALGTFDAGIARGSTRTLLGQLLVLPECHDTADEATCVPQPVADVELCAAGAPGRRCGVTDGEGRLALTALPTDRVRFELAEGSPAGQYLVAATFTHDDARDAAWFAELQVSAQALRLTLSEAGSVANAVASSVRVTSRPHDAGAIDVASDTAGVILETTAELIEPGDQVRVQVPRLPLPGESWSLTADRGAECADCDQGAIEIARLSSVRIQQPLPDAARLSARGALPPELASSIEKQVAGGVSADGVAAIDAAHRRLGGASGLLGAATSPHLDTFQGGVRRNYQRGAILWSRATGAHEVHGAILTLYDMWRGEAGPFGYPLTDELGTADGVGRRNFFEFAALYWTPQTGAHSVYGAILGRWGQLGAEQGSLGYPISDSLITPDGVGVFNYFQRGAIYWHPSYGPRVVQGEILAKWGALGWEAGPLGWPTSDEYRAQGRQNSGFENGRIEFRTHAPQLTVYTQNMGILVWPAQYGGTDPYTALEALIRILDRDRPDIVALQEIFDDDWYRALIRDPRISGWYSARNHGPEDGEPLHERDSDGGLVLLSHYPVLEWDQTVFRTCAGEDCFAAKGVQYAKVQVGPGLVYDVFNTHLNNDTPDIDGPLPSYRASVTNAQIDAIRSFVEAKRGTQQFPALLMGDFNVPGEDSQKYINLLARLGHPTDAWAATHTNPQGFLDDPGITFDPLSTFSPGGTEAGAEPHRLDYLFLFDGLRYQPWAEQMQVFRGKARFRDLSDHYGLTATLGHTQETNVRLYSPPSRVDVSLPGFYVHDLTGATPKFVEDVTGSTFAYDHADEVQWYLRVDHDGRLRDSSVSDIISVGGVDRGYRFTRAPTTRLGIAQNYVHVEVEGYERDTFGRDSLGIRELTFTRDELVYSILQPRSYRLSPHTRQSGEYTSQISLRTHFP